jgi:hypothetical protein
MSIAILKVTGLRTRWISDQNLIGASFTGSEVELPPRRARQNVHFPFTA